MGSFFSLHKQYQPQPQQPAQYQPQPVHQPPQPQPQPVQPQPVHQQPQAGSSYSKFELRILNAHNKARTENGLPPLEWDKALKKRAQDWARFLVKENEGRCTPLRHPGTDANGTPEEIELYIPGMTGQNIYQANGQRMTGATAVPYDPSSPEDAVQQWYDECNLYTSPAPGAIKPDKFLDVGHFTQVMWKDTTKVGCSYVECSDVNNGASTAGKMIVCDYDKGNVGGQFADQVPSQVKCEPKNAWISG